MQGCRNRRSNDRMPVHLHVDLVCRSAQGRRLDRRPLVELVKLFIDAYDRPDVFDADSISDDWENTYQDWLRDLKPGEHLTGDDVLHLLEFITEVG